PCAARVQRLEERPDIARAIRQPCERKAQQDARETPLARVDEGEEMEMCAVGQHGADGQRARAAREPQDLGPPALRIRVRVVDARERRAAEAEGHVERAVRLALLDLEKADVEMPLVQEAAEEPPPALAAALEEGARGAVPSAAPDVAHVEATVFAAFRDGDRGVDERGPRAVGPAVRAHGGVA